MQSWKHVLRWVALLGGLMLMGLAALRLTDLLERLECGEPASDPKVTCDIGPTDKLWISLLIIAVVGSMIWGAKAFLRHPRKNGK